VRCVSSLGKVHEVDLKPGQMLFYESAKCFHGRPKVRGCVLAYEEDACWWRRMHSIHALILYMHPYCTCTHTVHALILYMH
jgi:hypothetical protein